MEIGVLKDMIQANNTEELELVDKIKKSEHSIELKRDIETGW